MGTITNTVIAKAKSACQPGMKRYEVGDRVPGLVLVARPSGVVWQFRFKRDGGNNRLLLGPVDSLTIVEAREVATAAGTLLRTTPRVPDPSWLQHQLASMGKIDAPAPVVVRSRRIWTFEHAREQYLAEVQRTKSPATHGDYRTQLRSKDLATLVTKAVSSVTVEELAGIVGRIHASGRESTSEHLVRVLKPMWSWLAQKARSDDTGVAKGVLDELHAPERTRGKINSKVMQVPDLYHLGRIIAICRSGAVEPRIALGIELLVFTAQRRNAIATAEQSHFSSVDETRGFWDIPDEGRKRAGAGAHMIPLPAPVWAAVTKAKQIAFEQKSVWLFPQFRPRYAGGEINHIHPSTLTHTMGYMPGVPNPHAIRKALATHGEELLGFKRSDTQSILDHSEGGLRSSVTGVHYAMHNGSHYKWPLMNKWVDAVEAEVAKALAQEPELSDVTWLKSQIDAARYGTNDAIQEAAE